VTDSTSYSLGDVKDAKEADSDMELIYSWFSTNEQPSDSILFLSTPAAKCYWINRKNVFIGRSWRDANISARWYRCTASGAEEMYSRGDIIVL